MTLEDRDRDRVSKLVRQARAGDKSAFGDLVERNWLDLVAIARGVLASGQGAEDVVQEALVHAWKRLWMLRTPASFDAWMRRIVVRRSLTLVRRSRPRGEFVDAPYVPSAPGAARDVETLLSSLAPRQRAALYLSWILGYTDREVGSILGVSASTVRVHRHRGLQQLKKNVGRLQNE